MAQNPFSAGLGLGLPPGHGFQLPVAAPTFAARAAAAAATGNLEVESIVDEEEDGPASIQITVNSPITIQGDNNVVFVDPANTGTKMSLTMVNALKSISMSSCGIPMIDEQGRPRTVNIKLDAPLKIEGSGNSVGATISALTSGTNFTDANNVGFGNGGFENGMTSDETDNEVKAAVDRMLKLSKTGANNTNGEDEHMDENGNGTEEPEMGRGAKRSRAE